MHKSKGREFDNVFIMLSNYAIKGYEETKLLYVAMTRAKRNLYIHYNNNPFDQTLEKALNAITVPGLERYEDKSLWDVPNEIVMHAGLKDVWLDYFEGKQYKIDNLHSGDILKISGTECTDKFGGTILKFSREFSKKIEGYIQKGYKVTTVTINHIIYWTKEGTDNEIKIVLPEVWFEKV